MCGTVANSQIVWNVWWDNLEQNTAKYSLHGVSPNQLPHSSQPLYVLLVYAIHSTQMGSVNDIYMSLITLIIARPQRIKLFTMHHALYIAATITLIKTSQHVINI